MRISPVVVLIMAGALVLAVDAVIFVVPNALADPVISARPSVSWSIAPTAVDPASAIADAPSPTTFFDDPTFAPATTANAYIPTFTPGPATPTPTRTPSPKPKVTAAPYRDTVWNARTYVKNRVGAAGYNCINAVWTAESKWNPRAGDPNGAYGIPQAYPGTKMATFGSNWRYSPLTQVKWGLWYVAGHYGTACDAYNFWKNNGWY
jgi:hypothetical protein